MKVERFTVQACCGKTAIIFKTGRPIAQDLLTALVKAGFNESPNFTKAGILYVDNSELSMSGPFGSDRLQVTCKPQANCDQKLNDLEGLLLQLE
jgi:hypothetical protein